jgi:hypothetical protein
VEKRDRRVFEEVFNAVVNKARGIAEKMKKLFNIPLRIIDTPIIDRFKNENVLPKADTKDQIL